jgi:hypothetical protein
MSGWVKQALITFLTTAVISSVTTIAASQVALAVLNEKIYAIEARTTACERNCEKIRDDIYKPSWN